MPLVRVLSHTLSCLFALCLFLVLSCPARADTTLRVGIDGGYRPWSYLDESGKPTGFDVEIAEALCRAMSQECEFLVLGWEGVLAGMGKGELDMAVASMARTEDREKTMAFSDRYYRSRSVFIGPAESPLVLTPEGVKGKTLVTWSQSVQQEYIQERFGNSAEVRIVDTTEDILELLLTGKADAALIDSLTALELLQKEEGISLDFLGDPLPADEVSSAAHVAVRKNDAELLRRVNQALRSIRLNGDYERINRKYFPFSIY